MWKTGGTANRFCALLLALLVCLPVFASAELPPKGPSMQDLKDEARFAYERQFVQDVIGRMDAGGEKRKAMTIGNWHLHTSGFAFYMPEGYDLIGRYRGVTALLMEKNYPGSSFLTTIAVTVSQHDEKLLDKMGKSEVKTAYARQFQHFELLKYQYETVCGEDAIRISFLSGTSPQLLSQQCIFSKNGQDYVVTLTVENRFQRVVQGLEEFERFCDSLLFFEALEKK